MPLSKSSTMILKSLWMLMSKCEFNVCRKYLLTSFMVFALPPSEMLVHGKSECFSLACFSPYLHTVFPSLHFFIDCVECVLN